MNRSFKLFGFILGIFLLGLSSSGLFGANICIGPTATGNGSGTDWNNVKAWTASPVRGDVWYLMDGNYGSKVFTTAVSGTTRITIKKATDTEPGSAVGWNSTMGDGQAIITAPLSFYTGYFTINGQRRDESNWFDRTAYGIVIQSASNFNQPSVKVGGVTSSGGSDLSGPTAHGCEFYYVYVNAAVMPSVTVRSYQFDTESGSSTTGFKVSRSCVNNGNNHFFIRGTTGAIIEYTGSENAKNSSENHGEIYNLYYNAVGAIIRYNIARNNYDPGYTENATGYYAGTAMAAIVISDNCQIYGNLWYNNCTTDGAVGWNASNPANRVTNLKFYNNTIIGGWGASGIMLEPTSTGCVAYNNIWFGGPTPGFQACAHNYNAFSTTLSEANGQAITSAIFRNYAGGDYRLAAATAAGTPLAAPFNQDLTGLIRGGDGTFDRGSYEFGIISTNPVISISPINLDFGPVSTTTNRNLNIAVQNIGGGTLSGSATVASPFSIVSGAGYNLTAGQSQTVSVRYSPVAGGTNVASITFTGGAGTIATARGVGDATPPAVTLTAPSNGLTTGGIVNLVAVSTDDVVVSGVRLFINDLEMINDITSPYSYTWDSSSTSNGNYRICAQSRDGAGKTTWSLTNTITISNAPSVLPPAGAYWNFSEFGGVVAADSVSTNTMALRNGTTWTSAGKSGVGLRFDGINDYAEVVNSPALDINDNTMTVSAWVNLENTGTWQQILVKIKETGAFTSPYFAWHLFGGSASTTQWTPMFQLNNTTPTSAIAISSVAVNYGEWVHLVGVYDGSFVRIYINGVDRGSAALTGNVLSYNQPLYIGANGLPDEFMKGVIDEVRIYPGALTANQIQQLHQSYMNRPAPPGNVYVVSQ